MYKVGYRERNLHIRMPSFPSTTRRVPSGHGRESSVLYLQGPSVRPISNRPDARGPLNPGLPQRRCAILVAPMLFDCDDGAVSWFSLGLLLQFEHRWCPLLCCVPLAICCLCVVLLYFSSLCPLYFWFT